MADSSVNEDESLSVACGWVSDMWLCEMDRTRLEALNQPEVCEAYESLGGFVPNPANPDEIEKLSVEYCRLLVGPGPRPSPVQSVWQENQFQGQAAESMHRFFSILDGYSPPLAMADHLGTQLHFVSALLTSDSETQTKHDVLQQFYESHLTWTADYLEQLVLDCQSEFYHGLIQVTQNLISILHAND